MGVLGFTTQDLANLKAALVSGALIVQIGDRMVRYRDQKDIIQAIRMVSEDINGSPTDTVSTVQATFNKGSWGSSQGSGDGGAL
jgi:hypothetical protein